MAKQLKFNAVRHYLSVEKEMYRNTVIVETDNYPSLLEDGIELSTICRQLKLVS